MSLDYATGEQRRQPGWWAPIVGTLIGAFGLLWMAVGWGSVLTASEASQSASGVLLGMLTAAVLPGSLVGTFLGIVGVQRFGGALAWVALTLNLTVAALGVAAFIWSLS